MLRALAALIFKLTGWSVNWKLPEGVHRCVMIAAPHTSNWDFFYARLAFYQLQIPLRFTVKKEWLRFPVGGLMRAMGAIGIDRTPKNPGDERPSMTDAMAQLFADHDRLVVMVTPEGTRQLRTEWKTGFYYVAVKAGVPVGLGYLDYQKKEAGVGKMVYPSGDRDKDLREIMDFYRPIVGKHPEKFSVDTTV
jgi:1-acyl-sn-glycerol-3-phosphate acyltransferase